MYERRRKAAEFTILDAILVAVLPKGHQISSIAASLIDSGQGFPPPIEEAHTYASYLTETQDEEGKLVNAILIEVQRQLQIKIKRMDAQHKLRKDKSMGSQVAKTTRINRVCTKIFGPPVNWRSASHIFPKITSPQYAWLYRSPDGVLVAGLDWWSHRFLTAGFVYYNRRGPVRFIKLPSQTQNVKELYVLLGLHPRLLESPVTRVDWSRKAFIVADTGHLPWVYT